MKKRLYRCVECGALCRHYIWDALRIDREKNECPNCGKWAQFDLVAEAQAEEPAPEKAA